MKAYKGTLLESLRARQRSLRDVDLPGVSVRTALRVLSLKELRAARIDALAALEQQKLDESSRNALYQEEVSDHILVRAWVVVHEGEKTEPVCANVDALRESVDHDLRESLLEAYALHVDESDPRNVPEDELKALIEEVKKSPGRALKLSSGRWLRKLAHGLAVQLASSTTSTGSKSSDARPASESTSAAEKTA